MRTSNAMQLKAIIRNGSDRDASIHEIMEKKACTHSWAKKKYYADRKKLITFFSQEALG